MKVNDIAITKNFKLYEFECKDGNNQVKVDPEMVAKLQVLRNILNIPLRVNSGYRTPTYNTKIGGSPQSQHVLGKACDINKPTNITIDELAQAGKKAGFTGIGKYNWGCHFDVRTKVTNWDYRK